MELGNLQVVVPISVGFTEYIEGSPFLEVMQSSIRAIRAAKIMRHHLGDRLPAAYREQTINYV